MNYLRRRPTNNVPAGMGMTETDPVGLPQRTGARTTTTDSPSTGLAYNDTDPVQLPNRLKDLGWNEENPYDRRSGSFDPSRTSSGPRPNTPSTGSPISQPRTQYNYGEEGWDSQPTTYTTPNNPSRPPRDPRSKSLMEAYGASPIAGMDARTYAMLARYLPGSGTGVDPLSSPGQIAKYGGWEQFNKATMNPKVRALWDQFRGYNPNMKDYGDFSGGQMPWEKMGVAMPTGPRPGLGTFESTTNTPNPQFPAAGRTGTPPVTGTTPPPTTTTPPPAGSPITTGNRTDVGAYGKAIRGGTGIAPGQTPPPGTTTPPPTTTPNPTVANPTAGRNNTTNTSTGRFAVDPTTGMLMLDGQVLDRNDQRLWGTAGQYLNRGELDTSSPENPNPNYYDLQTSWQEESGGTRYRWVLKPEVLTRLGGRYQLRSAGISSGQEGQGFGEFNINYLNDLQYDPEFGITTSNPDFIDSSDDPDVRARWNRIRTAIAIAATGGMAAEAGLFGSAGATNAATGYGLGGAAGEAAAVGGMGGMGGVAGTTLATAGSTALETLTTAAAGGIESLTSAISSLLPNVTIPSGMSVGQLFSWARTALSAAGLIRGVTGGGNRTGTRTSGGGNVIDNLITGGINAYNDNRNIQNYEQQVREMIERGDPYGPYRAQGIAGLHNLVANPGSITANPLFSAMNNKSQADLSRVYGARGLGVSGNEMAGLQENFLANMNKFYGDEFNRYARMAGVDFNPASMAAAGMRSAADMFGARNNRNAANSALWERNGGYEGIWGAIRDFFGGNEGDPISDDDWEAWWDEIMNYGTYGSSEGE